MIYMVGLAITFSILIIIQAILVFLKQSKPPSEYIDGMTIIELKILADRYLSDNDKASMIYMESDEIDWNNVDQHRKDEILDRILEKNGIFIKFKTHYLPPSVGLGECNIDSKLNCN